jgi:hypothetical protein
MKLSAVLDRIDATLPEATARLLDLLRIPSISTDPAFRGDCARAADWLVRDLQSLGFQAASRPTPGHPMVVAQGGSGGRHLLFYGHYDVQPVDPLELWHRDPFDPVIEDTAKGKVIRGRGSADDKGQLMTFLEACRAWKAVHGTLPGRRGSITIDDEGTPSNCTTLIENGILTGFMQDRLNARLMGVAPTGNGRRQSYAHAPMPRMTNTYMLNGGHAPEEILASMKSGLFARSFGRITRPVKGATLIGSGADALTRIAMVGNDMALDPGIGTCGKQGQGVPVGVGQPSIRINRLTVGGTAA